MRQSIHIPVLNPVFIHFFHTTKLTNDSMPKGWLAHEVVQTSAMDCGPASFKSLLESLGISISYDRLREACQTDIDGTSIDTLEEVANQIGLEAEQIMLPRDHGLLAEAHALPAVVVVRLPNANIHFVVLWRHHGPFVQIMDPAIGRRWVTSEILLKDLYIHTFPVLALDWRVWAETSEFIQPLEKRMLKFGIKSEIQAALIASAKSDSDWFALDSLDAVVRMLTQLVRSGGVKRGRQAARLLREIYTRLINNIESASIIVLLRKRWRKIFLLKPDGSACSVSARDIETLLFEEQREAIRPELDSLLEFSGIDPAYRARTFDALLRERAKNKWRRKLWRLRPYPGFLRLVLQICIYIRYQEKTVEPSLFY